MRACRWELIFESAEYAVNCRFAAFGEKCLQVVADGDSETPLTSISASDLEVRSLIGFLGQEILDIETAGRWLFVQTTPYIVDFSFSSHTGTLIAVDVLETDAGLTANNASLK